MAICYFEEFCFSVFILLYTTHFVHSLGHFEYTDPFSRNKCSQILDRDNVLENMIYLIICSFYKFCAILKVDTVS